MSVRIMAIVAVPTWLLLIAASALLHPMAPLVVAAITTPPMVEVVVWVVRGATK
jgi:hypothetical protein